jgi:hypothetical protein
MIAEAFIITRLEKRKYNGKGVIWVNCFTHDNRKMTFWGNWSVSEINVRTIENQRTPFIVEVIGAEHDNAKYGIDVFVGNACKITINPTLHWYIEDLLSPDNIENLEANLKDLLAKQLEEITTGAEGVKQDGELF